MKALLHIAFEVALFFLLGGIGYIVLQLGCALILKAKEEEQA